jgi:hypothetical protein
MHKFIILIFFSILKFHSKLLKEFFDYPNQHECCMLYKWKKYIKFDTFSWKAFFQKQPNEEKSRCIDQPTDHYNKII